MPRASSLTLVSSPAYQLTGSGAHAVEWTQLHDAAGLGPKSLFTYMPRLDKHPASAQYLR